MNINSLVGRAQALIGGPDGSLPPPNWTFNFQGTPIPPGFAPQEAAAPAPQQVATKVFRFKGPDGMIHKISGPADATPEQAFAQLQTQFAQPTEQSDTMGQLENYGENALKGAAALGTGVAKGVASVGGMAGDLAANMTPKNDVDRLMAMTDPIWWISRQFPSTQNIRTAVSGLTGGASEYQPDPNDPNARIYSDIQAAGAGLPTWGKRLGLGALSGVLGNEVENSGLFGGGDAARAIGNVSPVALPILGRTVASLSHGLHAIPEFFAALLKLGQHPLEAAANAAIPATSAEMQYQANQPAPIIPQ